MEFGAHLPVIGFHGPSFSLPRLLDYTETVERLGFTTLCVNDHLIATRPWLDSVTALASVMAHTHRLKLMTMVLPVVRGPIPLAKALAALDVLLDGRIVVGAAPGSLPQDYALVNIAFEERWKRFDEVIQLLRSLLRPNMPPFRGQFYTSPFARLEPFPAQEAGLPIWIGSWGSEAGLRRVAHLGDGWLASAYNATPDSFADGLTRLSRHLQAAGKAPDRFPNALASMFCYLTEDSHVADKILTEMIGPTLVRSIDLLRERLLVGSAAECIEKLLKLKEVGVQQVFLWPVDDELVQLKLFYEQVIQQIPK